MSIVVRRVDIADELVREQIHLLHQEVFTAEQWQHGKVPRFKTGYWWIAFVDGEPAGFGGMRPSARWDGTGYMCSAGVLKKFRRRGLQRRLIQKRVQMAAQLGWHTVITDTVHDNASSMRSLIACGFRPYVPQVQWGDKDSAVYWIRSTTRKVA